MNINSLELQNFKSIKKLSIDFGKVTNISADNGLGKTTVYDAFCYLLWGKTSLGKNDADSFKPVVNNKMVRKVDVTVKANIDDVVYMRTLHEKWTKKKGQASHVYGGNQHLFEIDGLPVMKNQFEAEILKVLGDSSLFKILSDVTAFMGLHWKERRALLLTDTTQLDEMSKDLEIQKHAKKKIDDTIDEYPVRIEEQYDSLVEVEKPKELILSEIADLEAHVSEVREKKASASNGGSVLALKEQKADTLALIIETENKISDIKASSKKGQEDLVAKLKVDDENKSAESNSEANIDAQLLLDEKNKLNGEIDIAVKSRSRHSNDLSDAQDKVVRLRENWATENSREFTGETLCNSCGQYLPETEIDTAKKSFNKIKSESLATIVADANSEKEKVEKFTALITPLDVEIDTKRKRVEEIGSPQFKNTALVESPEYLTENQNLLSFDETFMNPKDLVEELEGLKKVLEQIQTDIDNSEEVDVSIYDEKITDVDAQIKALNALLSTIEENTKKRTRIKTLEDEQSEKCSESAKLEGKIFKIEGAISTLMKEIEADVNKRFSFTKFKLFEVQINGGMNPVCVPVVNGIDYDGLNNALKINVGIDIINTLSKEKGVNYPIWVDNAESVNEIEQTESQLIRLVVTKDPKLKVEVASV